MKIPVSTKIFILISSIVLGASFNCNNNIQIWSGLLFIATIISLIEDMIISE